MAGEAQNSFWPWRHVAALQLAGWREIFAIDLRTLAIFRMGLAALLIVDLLLRARDLTAHYTDFGVFPRAALVDYLHPGAFSFHLMNGSAWIQALLFLIAAIAALMLLAGWRTRTVSVLSWVLLLSVQNRNPMILSGEDNLLMVLAFWAMFLPLGARYSVDAALDTGGRRHPSKYVSIATAALLIQGMSMYLFSAVLKSGPQWIPEGTAVYYALQLDYFATPFAHWFRQFGGLLQGLTYYVWTVELIGPFLMFSPLFHRQLRAAFQLVFITMHIGFLLCLEIGIFPLVSILMNLTFTQGWVWDRLDRAIRRRGQGVQIFYDEGCDFCLKICLLLRAFLRLPQAVVAPAPTDPQAQALLVAHHSWVVRDSSGNHVRWEAMLALFAASPLGVWPGKVLGLGLLRRAGERLYAVVARHRPRLSRLTACVLPFGTVRVVPGRLTSVLVLLFAVFVFVQNLTTVPRFPYRLPEPVVTLRQFLGLYQNWTMFAPYPEVTSPWPVIPGRLTDGTLVDVYNGRAGAPDWTKPKYVSQVYTNYRWRKYLSNIEDMSYGNVRPDFALNYARYLCRLWNHGASEGRELATFEIYFQVEWSPPDYQAKKPVRRRVWTHNCFA